MSLRRTNLRIFRSSVKAQLAGLSIMAGKTPEAYGAHIPKQRVPRKPSTAKRESTVNEEIRDFQRDTPDLTLWRNNRGAIQLDSGGWLRYGVGPNGASDHIGYTSVIVTPAMVGQRIAIFTAVEAKAPKKGPREDQQRFIDRVLAAGGRAGVARNVEDAERIIA